MRSTESFFSPPVAAAFKHPWVTKSVSGPLSRMFNRARHGWGGVGRINKRGMTDAQSLLTESSEYNQGAGQAYGEKQKPGLVGT